MLKDTAGTSTYVMPKPLKKAYQRRRAAYMWLSGFAIVIMAFTYVKLQTDFDLHATIQSLFKESSRGNNGTLPPKKLGWFGETIPKGMKKSHRKGEYIWLADKSVMLYVPKGKFWRGSKLGKKEEQPERMITLSSFYIDKYELSNKKYRYFIKLQKRKLSKYLKHEKWGDDRRPAVALSWYDAKAYAKWAKKKLPTEAQWEKAARGGVELIHFHGNDLRKEANGFPKRIFTWGNTYKKEYSNQGKKKNMPLFVSSFLQGRSPYGCHNMLGNVWEWCADYYHPEYYALSPLKNPNGPKKKSKYRVCRGGSWNTTKVFTYSRRKLPPKEKKIYMGARFVVLGAKSE